MTVKESELFGCIARENAIIPSQIDGTVGERATRTIEASPSIESAWKIDFGA